MTKLTFDLNNPVQTDFLGLGAVYHGFAGQPDECDRVYTEEQCILEAERAAHMRVKVARTYYKWWAWDEKTGTWDWDNERMTPFCKWLQRLKDANIDVALNTGWCNVTDIMSTGWGGKSPFTVEGDWQASVKNYAKWVSETYKELVVKRGFTNIKYFCLFTEPNEGGFKLPFENADYRWLWYDSVKAAHEQLVEDGYRDKIKLLGPQQGVSLRPWFTEWAFTETNVADYLDGGSLHNYLCCRELDECDVHSGKYAVLMPYTNAKIQQSVTLKKNTDYVASIWMKSKISSEAAEGSSITFGVYGKGSHYHYFMNYCWPQDEVFVKDVTPAELKGEWTRYEIAFNSGELEEVNVCIYSKMKRTDGKTDNNWAFMPGQLDGLFSDGLAVLCDDFSLREIGTETELITDGSFESSLYWDYLGGRPLSCDAYATWSGFQRDYIAVLPDKFKNDFYHDEYNTFFGRHTREHGIWLALGQVAMMNGGGKCSFLWTLFDQQWPNDHNNSLDSFFDGDHRCGLMPNLRRGILAPYPPYYAWGLVSRYTGGKGTHCFEGKNLSDEKIAANLNRLPDGNYTLTVVNYGRKPLDFTADFGKNLARDFNRHSYVSATIEPDESGILQPIDKVYKEVKDSISDTLPPMSLAVYTTLGD